VHYDDLRPADVAQVELFAHRVGSALENVRHHRRAAERLAEVERLQHRLIAQERLATLGETAAVLAHEVRNPVAAILNALVLLRRQGGAHSEPVRIAEEEALRLERLVNDLLHLARPLEPRAVPFDLVTLAERTLTSVRARVDHPPVTLELKAAAPVPINADSFLLGLAVENLLLNAVRVSPPRGRVEVVVERAGGRVRLAVDDMGPGVKPEIAARIFEPFFTTHATGTGLGLAVVRKVIEAHRGRVRAAQSPLGGARFELELPGD
jgi:signal transduction histidine kinase